MSDTGWPSGPQGKGRHVLAQRTLPLITKARAPAALSARAQPMPRIMGKNWGSLGFLEPL